MSNRIVATLGAGALTVGILIGAAAAILVGNGTVPDREGMSRSASQMNGVMGGSMMGGAHFAGMAELHAQHHGTGR